MSEQKGRESRKVGLVFFLNADLDALLGSSELETNGLDGQHLVVAVVLDGAVDHWYVVAVVYLDHTGHGVHS